MISNGLIIMVVGLLVVFGFLALIVVCIQITSLLLQFGSRNKTTNPAEIPNDVLAGIIALTYQQQQKSR